MGWRSRIPEGGNAGLKRPAAAAKQPNIPNKRQRNLPDMSDVFAKLRKVPLNSISKGAFTSRAYDAAYRRMNALNFEAYEGKAFAREQYDVALQMWSRRHG